jgi:uncharacterized protein YjdB
MKSLTLAASKHITLRGAILAALVALIAGLTACTSPLVFPVTGTRVSSVAMNKASLTLPIGGAETLSAVVAPTDAANKAVAWYSDSANASVSATGLVSALQAGTANVSATTMDGSFTATCLVTVVVIPVTGVSMNPSSKSIGLGMTAQLAASTIPSNATNQGMTWSSSSANASVSSTGLVTANALGSATITATSADGAFKASCAVTVIPVPVTGVTLNKSSLSLAAGYSEVLVATVYPANAADKTLTWSSANNNIAPIVDGQVLGLAAGTTTITVKTADGAFTASCAVTVTGSLSHSYAEAMPAITALQDGLTAAMASNDPSSPAYAIYVISPAKVLTCYLQNYVDGVYKLNGNVAVAVNPDYTQGPMNGTISFAGGPVATITYVNAVFAAPKSGSLVIKFIDGVTETLNLATGILTQG